MDKVLVMLAAGNAARKVNSIQKTMSFSFSSQKGGYNHLFFHSVCIYLKDKYILYIHIYIVLVEISISI